MASIERGRSEGGEMSQAKGGGGVGPSLTATYDERRHLREVRRRVGVGRQTLAVRGPRRRRTDVTEMHYSRKRKS